jgi:hypothetical protein
MRLACVLYSCLKTERPPKRMAHSSDTLIQVNMLGLEPSGRLHVTRRSYVCHIISSATHIFSAQYHSFNEVALLYIVR